MSPKNGGWGAGSFNSKNKGWSAGSGAGHTGSSGRRRWGGAGRFACQTGQEVEVELAGARRLRSAIDSKVRAGCFGVKSGVY